MIPKRSKIFFLFYSTALTFIFSLNSTAQINNVRFDKLSVQSGLSPVSIEAVLQDTRGFLWIGTQSGLFRFDGNEFKLFKNDLNDIKSIPNHDIRCIFEISGGNLLLGSFNSDLIEYNFDSDTFRKIYLPVRSTLIRISAMTEDNSGNIWIGTEGDGLFKLDKNINLSFHYVSDPAKNSKTINSNVINYLYYDRNSDKLYIGTSGGGINILNIKNQSFSYILNDVRNPNSLSDNRITFILRDSRKMLWAGTYERGLNKLDETNNTFQRYMYDPHSLNSISNNRIVSMCEDNQGYLWIATSSPELNCFELDKDIFTLIKIFNETEIDNKVECLLKDKSNVIWAGTRWGGFTRVDREKKKFNNIFNINSKENITRDKSISALIKCAANSVLFQTSELFTFYKAKYNNNNYSFNSIKEFQNKEIYKISEDLRSNLWITSRYNDKFSIILSDSNMENFIYYNFKEFAENNYVYSQLNDRNNPDCIWLGFYKKGLVKFDRTKNNMIDTISIPNSLRNISVSSLFMDSESILWIGSRENGLFKYDISKNAVTNYLFNPDDSESISDNFVNCITQDFSENIWIGTINGLNKLKKEKNKFKRISETDGLSDNNVYAILPDNKNNLWLSTMNGICRYDNINNSFNCYFEGDGLMSGEYNEGSYYKSKDGTLYFGGYGITYFNPTEIKDNPFVPNIVLTDFQIFNESIKPSPENPFLKKNILATKDITLSYKESVFSFDFAALIYNNSSKNQYAYMMEGFDKEWVYCGTRRNVTYTNLDPGDYTFKVKGSNNDGIWNEEGTSIKITITPPWWQTWWFKSCGATMIFLTVGFGYKRRMNKLKKEKEIQEEYSRKLLASQEEERKRIANELHDSIAHDILILKNDVVTAMNATKEEETKNALNKISDQSTETLNEVRNISYNLHPHQIEALGITKAIRSIIDKSSGSSKVNFIHDIENIDKIFTEENEVHIFRIIQEAISNIIKYSDSTEAIIKISCTKKSVSILISDIGKGFDIEKVEKGSLGLSGIAERVKILGGVMDIESKRGEGTVFKIDLPVKD